MKKLFLKTIAIAAAIVASAAITSCGDDDKDEPKQPDTQPQTIVSYEVVNEMQCDQDVFTYYDVTVTYIGSDGKKKTETVNAPFNKTISINAAVIPSSVAFQAVGTPKANYPEIDPDQVYHLGHSVKLTLIACTSSGSKKPNGTNSGSNLPTSGAKLSENLAAGRTLHLGNLSINVK